MKIIISGFLLILFLASCSNLTEEDKNAREPISVKTHQLRESDELKLGDNSGPVFPIEHASFGLRLNQQMIYVDPMGNSALYAGLPGADLVLVTHYHPDYLVPGAIEALVSKQTVLLVPENVRRVLPENLRRKAEVLKPGESKNWQNIDIQVLQHEQELLGYLIKTNNRKIFIAQDINSEIHTDELKSIDMALVQMNLTNTVELQKTIDYILRLNPKKVFPYYYNGEFIYSKVAVLKKQVEKEKPDIKVEVLNWYPDPEEINL